MNKCWCLIVYLLYLNELEIVLTFRILMFMINAIWKIRVMEFLVILFDQLCIISKLYKLTFPELPNVLYLVFYVIGENLK